LQDLKTTKVKICGTTNLKDAELCIEAGADFLGFVTEFPVDVPWNLTREEAKNLIDKIRDRIATVVVTSGTVEKISDIVELIHSEFVQLHGRETLNDIRKLVDRFTPAGIKIIKALPIELDTGKAFFEIEEPKEAALAIQSTGVWAITLDSKTSSMPAGTGKVLDWTLARELRETVALPVFLAGGLTCDNVASAVRDVRPFAVDVITGVEGVSRYKDPEKIKLFIGQVQSQ